MLISFQLLYSVEYFFFSSKLFWVNLSQLHPDMHLVVTRKGQIQVHEIISLSQRDKRALTKHNDTLSILRTIICLKKKKENAYFGTYKR